MGRFRDGQRRFGFRNRLNRRIQSGPCRRIGGGVMPYLACGCGIDRLTETDLALGGKVCLCFGKEVWRHD